MTLFDLKGRVALVTGGGRGLGEAMAAGLAQAGAHVVLAGRSTHELEAAVAAIRAQGGIASYVIVDLMQDGAHEQVVRDVVAKAGRLDVLLHAAGMQVRKNAIDITADDWDRVTDIHLRTAFLLAQATARHAMAEQAAAKIIFVGSLTSHIGFRGIAPYAAAKSGVAGLARTLAAEWATSGINVNTIIPGYFHTKLTGDLLADEEKHRWVMSRIPMNRLGDPQDLAGAAVFFASTASDYVTGAEIRVDGGWLAS
ncbi:SDR family oxidoreductase [Ottowia thiooxydans]|uniref:2-deoxy-D-gluconate 3-dehydrogenase n=1 Tax=Ottowia thiooxydans TaxID=219182 RepID=A0ABV2Q5B4_9BURK